MEDITIKILLMLASGLVSIGSALLIFTLRRFSTILDNTEQGLHKLREKLGEHSVALGQQITINKQQVQINERMLSDLKDLHNRVDKVSEAVIKGQVRTGRKIK